MLNFRGVHVNSVRVSTLFEIMWSKCLYNRIIEIWWNAITHPRQSTLPKTNIAPENRPGRKKKFIFRTIHFQMGAVKVLGRVYFLKVSIFLRSHPHTPGRYHRKFFTISWNEGMSFWKRGKQKGYLPRVWGCAKSCFQSSIVSDDHFIQRHSHCANHHHHVACCPGPDDDLCLHDFAASPGPVYGSNDRCLTMLQLQPGFPSRNKTYLAVTC